MSPIKRLGGRDAQRGTEAEYSHRALRRQDRRRDGSRVGDRPGHGAAPRRRGASVACLDVAEDKRQSDRRDMRAREQPSRVPPTTATSRTRVPSSATVERVAAELGAPNVVCNVAGIGGFAHSTEQSLEGWNRIIASTSPGPSSCAEPLSRTCSSRGVRSPTSSRPRRDGPAVLGRLLRLQGRAAMLTRRSPSSTSKATCGSMGSHPAVWTRRSCTTSASPKGRASRPSSAS